MRSIRQPKYTEGCHQLDCQIGSKIGWSLGTRSEKHGKKYFNPDR
jgi:hypothetical protein